MLVKIAAPPGPPLLTPAIANPVHSLTHPPTLLLSHPVKTSPKFSTNCQKELLFFSLFQYVLNLDVCQARDATFRGPWARIPSTYKVFLSLRLILSSAQEKHPQINSSTNVMPRE